MASYEHQEQDNTTVSSALLPEDCPLTPTPSTDEDAKVMSTVKKEWEENTWTFELASLLLGAVSFALAIMLLSRFDGKPLSEWTMAVVSLNTLLAILTTVSRASLGFCIGACIAQGKWNWFLHKEDSLVTFDRFDAASQGSLGCLRLMKTVARRPHWVLLGSMCTITLGGYGPLMQAILRFENGMIAVSSTNVVGSVPESHTTATIGRQTRLDVGSCTTSLNAALLNFQNLTASTGEVFDFSAPLGYDIRRDLGTMASIWTGISPFTTDQNLWPSFTCATGNCTWPPFASLALCSTCHDISAHIRRTHGVTDALSVRMGSMAPGVSGMNRGPILKPTNATVGKGGLAFTNYELRDVNLTLSNYNGSVYPCSSARMKNCTRVFTSLTGRMVLHPKETVRFKDQRALLFSFPYLVANTNISDIMDDTRWETSAIIAGECALHYCINEYNITVEKGSLSEDIIASWSNKTTDSYSPLWTFDSPDLYHKVELYTDYWSNTLSYESSSWNRGDLQLYIPAGFGPLSGFKANISQNTIGSTLDFFTSSFGSTEPCFYPPLPYDYWKTTKDMISALGVVAAEDIPEVFSRIARSMTKYIRDQSLRTDPVKGTVHQSTLIFRARWQFVALPAATLFTGVIFVGLSIWDTRRKRLPVWKGSALTTMAFGLGGPDKAELRHAVLSNRAMKLARGERAKFHFDGGAGSGLWFHEHKASNRVKS